MSPFDDKPLYRVVRDVALALHGLDLQSATLESEVRQSSAALYLNTVLLLRSEAPQKRRRYASRIGGKIARLDAALELAGPTIDREPLRRQLGEAWDLVQRVRAELRPGQASADRSADRQQTGLGGTDVDDG